MNKTHVLVVNRNCLKFLKDCISDLQRQTTPFDLTIIDNGSTEGGTLEYLNSLFCNVILNPDNVPLNHLWNWFYEDTQNPYLCFLNNDVRIPTNFIKDSEDVFDIAPTVGITCHATNNPLYQKTGPLAFKILDSKVRQGWDFTMRRELYEPIPEELKWFCGDDLLWKAATKNGKQGAAILSSPIIHYQGRTSRKDIKSDDYSRYKKMEIFDGPMTWSPYSLVRPKITEIMEMKS